jgi:hypothetical protein
MGQRFTSGKKALGICDVCGFQYKLRELAELIVKGRKTNLLACPECWSADHPQNKLGLFPVDDPQAIRKPRPDSNEYPQSRARLQPSGTVVAVGAVGYVTISIV